MGSSSKRWASSPHHSNHIIDIASLKFIRLNMPMYYFDERINIVPNRILLILGQWTIKCIYSLRKFLHE